MSGPAFAKQTAAVTAHRGGSTPGWHLAELSFAVVGTFLSLEIAVAQDVPSAEEQGGAPAEISCPIPAGAMVTKAIRLSRLERTDPAEIRLGDEIQLHLTGLPSLQKCADSAAKPILLYLDDQAIPGLLPTPRTDPASGSLRFTLRIDDASRETWRAMLGSPTKGEDEVKASVGLQDAYPLPSNATLRLDPVPGWWFSSWLVVLAVLTSIFLWLAAKTNIIREGRANLAGSGRGGPYSLAKSQAAWWFFFILASYLFIGIVTGDFAGSINATALALLGIGAGTAVISATIDSSKDTEANKARENAALLQADQDRALLAADVQALEQQLAATKQAGVALKKIETELEIAKRATPVDTVAVSKLESDRQAMLTVFDPAAEIRLTQELAERRARVAEVRSETRKLRGESENFLTDIVSDANGASFHRFQIVAWTIVLSIVFIREVYANLAMPEFSAELLGLQGLSAATYLGLKTQEPVVPTN